MKKLDIKKRFKQSSFLRTLNIIRKNPTIYLYTLVIDFIFLAIIMFTGRYIGSLIPQDPQQLMTSFGSMGKLILFVIIYPIVYYLFGIFIYSISKLSILNLIRSLYKEHKFSLKGLSKFYTLNILIFFLFFLGGAILLGILTLLFERSFFQYILRFLIIPFLLLLYIVTQMAHLLFLKNIKAIKKSFSISFKKIKKYGAFILWNIIIFLAYLAIYNIIHIIFRTWIFADENILLTYGLLYLKIFNIITLIVVYLILSFNRIYLYERLEDVLS